MEEHRKLEQARLECFKKCKGQEVLLTSDYPEDRELKFFHSVIQESWCIKHCEEDLVAPITRGVVTSFVFNQLKSKEGYNYLQIAYYNVRAVDRGLIRGEWLIGMSLGGEN